MLPSSKLHQTWVWWIGFLDGCNTGSSDVVDINVLGRILEMCRRITTAVTRGGGNGQVIITGEVVRPLSRSVGRASRGLRVVFVTA